MKKISILTLLALASIQPLCQAGGSGAGWGFLGGAALGTGITLAATSGSRNPKSDAYYDNKDREAQRRQIRNDQRDAERQLNKSQRQLSKERRKLEQLQNKGASADEIKEQKDIINDQETAIKEQKQTINDLKADLRDI